MASTGGAAGWLKGIVKGVPSGDSLVIMGITKAELPPEKTITLSSLMAPKLAPSRGGVDEPFAWDSREYLRKLCIGKEVVFNVDYTVPTIRREFGSVFIGEKNVASLMVAAGWAKVRDQGQQKGEASPFLVELLQLEEQAKQQGLGRWSRVPGATEASVRKLPPSAVHNPGSFDAMAFLTANKGTPLEAIVDLVPGGTTLRVYMLPELQYVQVFVAGVQAPGPGRKAAPEAVIENNVASNAQNGDSTSGTRAPRTSAQRLAAASGPMVEVPPEPFGMEAKHFTETRVLHRDVRIVLEGVDKKSNLTGSVHYQEGESSKDLAAELVDNGLAKYVEWSASLLEDDVKRRLKNAELQAKKARLRMWTNYVPPATNSKAIHDQNFTGKVVEVVSGDCIVVADDSLPFGHPSAERRVNLSSIRGPKMGNPRRDIKADPYARDAKEFLRTRLIGRQVNVSMEYSRKVVSADGPSAASGATDRVMDFGSVFLVNPSKDGVDTAPGAVSQQAGTNVAELLVARGFATVVRHRDFEERSNYYDALLSAESRAVSGKKGIHSAKDPPVRNVTDLLTSAAKKAKDFLPFLLRNRRMSAVVDYVLSGHRFKVEIPKATCSIAFSLSGVRCPGREEPYSDEAIALMRRMILQRDVEIEVETADRTGTFLGTLWLSKTNVAISLLEAGLAKLQASFGIDRIQDGHLLVQAEQSAKQKKLKIWHNFVEGEEEAPNGTVVEKKQKQKQKEELKVVVTEVLEGGKFYVQSVTDQKVASIKNQISSLNLQEQPPVIGNFNPKKGDIVLAQYSHDNSWNRAMIVNAPRGLVESANDKSEVFYIDYGNQEIVTYSRLRPLDPSISSGAGLAQLCSLSHVKVPRLEDGYGQEAAFRLNQLLYTNVKTPSLEDLHNKEECLVNSNVKVSTLGDDYGQEACVRRLSEDILNENVEFPYLKDLYNKEQVVRLNKYLVNANVEVPTLEDDYGQEAFVARLSEDILNEVEVPNLEDGYGEEATVSLSEQISSGQKEFKAVIEEIDTSLGKVKGQGTGTVFMVDLIDAETNVSINAIMLQEGLARLEKRRRWEPKEKKQALDKLEKYQNKAREMRRGMWEYGDIASDDEDTTRPVRKASGKQ